MLEQSIAIKAARQLNGVVQQITEEQWVMKMPPDFQTFGEPEPPLREVLNYHAYDDAWIPDMLDGKTMDEVGADAYKGDLLGDNPKAAFSEYVDRACVAIDKLDDPERTVHCSFGDFTAREYLWQVISFRGLRAHDIAKAIGVDSDLPDDLVQGMWTVIEPHAEEWRAIGVYQAAIPVPEDAPLQDRLLAITGRQPK